MTHASIVRHVKIGELACADAPGRLKATLGSCVGIALWWPQRQRAALAHCLLPDSTADDDSLHGRVHRYGPARCVDRAVPALLDSLGVPTCDLGQLRAWLGGGASLRRAQTPVHPSLRIGERNVQAARRSLAEAGIAVVDEQVEGREAMQIGIDSATGEVTFLRIKASDG